MGLFKLVLTFDLTTAALVCSAACSHMSLITAVRMGVVAGWVGGDTRASRIDPCSNKHTFALDNRITNESAAR
eukprot:8838322-Pyramimonas_sp.AAC.1